MQNFIHELSNYLENLLKNSNSTNLSTGNFQWNNLLSDDLTLYNCKITTKFRDKMLLSRRNILEEYALNSLDKGEMFYIYDTHIEDRNSYLLTNCHPGKSHEVLTHQIEELPNGSVLGNVLRKQGNNFVLDVEVTQIVEKKINSMIKQQIEEQQKYLDSLRIDGHIYEVGEKSSGRLWLYDLNNTIGEKTEGFEEINFPKYLYETAKEGDLFVYQNGEYHKKI